ncbi:HlyD family efflux transporter periplasmic adaptor subunit [Cobetia crustatorum]|uniref:HlyD family efflux transporter periplasmic adaptor subunit n=1 Tax=Cobetia crustatorum TaxID=553385 RepID=A0A558HEA2_9GAMM|nr:HlyD family efflux transporter periplasmic adaptor subunit [Cobetia crustatorum]TVU67471.1 HlyD family efflux transporter periplasmic adaptor subunit [Cobetia crustatorum]
MISQPPPLAVLRQDLKLHPVEQDRDGKRRWLLHDPVAQRFYRLGESAIELLPFIRGGQEATVAKEASSSLGREVPGEQLRILSDFLRQHDLVCGDPGQQERYQRRLESRPKGLKWLMHHYLFVRIPLANPDRWLDRHLNKVRWLGSRRCFWGLLAMLLLGLWLTVRQLDTFLASFAALGAIGGWLTLGIALVFVKVLHELGHAFVAKAKGARVPTIGVAFIVGWPVLYTDTSDAWRLTEGNDRVKVDIAGVAVEISISILALLCWHLLPEGVLRTICFWLATTTWIMSALVNFNPLMRFDGYYLLSDAWRQPNLEPRSQALARWQLREWLFGFKENPPERPRRALIGFAMGVWVYRLLLFLGIALAVYHFFFKLLGIVLFAVEIWYFIMRPIINEIRRWFSEGRKPRANMALLRTSLIVAALGVFLLWPWQSELRLPGWLEQASTRLEAPFGGRVSLSVRQDESVVSGQSLATISAPEVAQRLATAQRRTEQLDWRRSASGLDRRLLQESPVVQADLTVQRQRVNALEAEQATGRLMAPYTGQVHSVNPALMEGGWVGKGEWLMTLRNPDNVHLTAWVEEEEVLRISADATAWFYPLSPAGEPMEMRVTNVEPQSVEVLEQPEMAIPYGGPLRVREGPEGELELRRSLYRVTLKPMDREQALIQSIPGRRGVVNVQTEARSLVSRTWREAVGVWRRESGF